jgi:hypothetical protein
MQAQVFCDFPHRIFMGTKSLGDGLPRWILLRQERGKWWTDGVGLLASNLFKRSARLVLSHKGFPS